MTGRSPEEREYARLEREARRKGLPPPPPPARPAPPQQQQQGGTTQPSGAADGTSPGGNSGRRPPDVGTFRPRPAPPRATAARKAQADAVIARSTRRQDEEPRRRRLAAPILVLGVVAALAAAWFLNGLYQPFAGDGGERVRVTIPRGGSVGEIADRLADAGVVDRPFFFKLRARLDGHTSDLKPGSYTLREDMAYDKVLATLAKGPPRNIVNLTIPEGRARREIAPIVRQAGLRGSYTRASAASDALDPRRYGARTRNLEGFLFPATYELKRGASASDLVERQLKTFRDSIAKVDMSYAKDKNLSVYDVLIIASMVEREAQVAVERPLVAAVIYNRLKEGIPLGIDATLRFALNNWTRPLRVSELASTSRYNTRNRQGLPPGPIGNPGLDSIKAAARPSRKNYLFYVVKPGTCGRHSFAATDAEHQRNVAAYNAAREAKGGKSPTTC